MTVSVKRNQVQFGGDGSTTAFTVNFPYTELDQVKVFLDTTEQTRTTHFTLTDPGATGTVTFLSAPASGVLVTIKRETDYLQAIDYVNNDALDAETLEKAFDKLTMMCQQLDVKIEKSIGFEETVSEVDTTSLKLAAGTADLAGKLLAFDSTGAFVTTQEIGTFKGSDTTTTTAAYVVRDLIRDSSNDNVYFTKQDAPSGTLLTNTSYFELLVDVATVRQLKVDAETAKTDAETAQTGAEAALASFEGQFKTGATNPYSGTPDNGDLWYDTANNILKYYVTGTGFEPVTTSLATVTDNYLTISNQVITAGTVPISLGGTGATTAPGARTALGLGTAATTAATDYATADQGATADTALQNVVDDTTPQLGGNLDVNGNSIVSASNGNIAITPNGTGNVSLGNFTFDADQTVGVGQDNYVLTYDHSTTSISLEAATGGGGGSDVVSDTSPQLGGNLDVNGNSIVSASNGNIAITPNGTGNVSLGNFTFDADQTVGAAEDNYILTYNHSTTSIGLEANTGSGGGLTSLEHSNSVSTAETISAGDHRFYVGPVSFSNTLTIAGKLLVFDGLLNTTGTINTTGTLHVRS